MAIGWIRLHRQIQDSDMWDSEDEPFDRRSAWIDLLMMANHKDKETVFGNQIITVKAGQRITSLVKLSERWNWSRDKVRRYLDLLEKLGMVTRESDNKKTVITIVNYCKYQGNDADDNTANKTADKTTNRHQIRQQIDTNKNIKNDIKNEKKYIYGEFGHVMLSDQERQRLVDDYGENLTNKAIKAVDEYCQQYGKKYKDYYLAIRKWGIDAAKKANGDERDEDPNLKLILQKIEKEGWA